jgi:hypothetical protein
MAEIRYNRGMIIEIDVEKVAYAYGVFVVLTPIALRWADLVNEDDEGGRVLSTFILVWAFMPFVLAMMAVDAAVMVLKAVTKTKKKATTVVRRRRY